MFSKNTEPSQEREPGPASREGGVHAQDPGLSDRIGAPTPC